MSRSSFAAKFKQAAGQAPLAYLSRWRIRLAGRALRDADKTVAVIADDLGYASESSLSHAFARTLGMSPVQYRRSAAPSP